MARNENTRMVPVDLEVLNRGLMTAFQGMAMIFSSLGAPEAAEEITAVAKDKSVMKQEPEGGCHPLVEEEKLPFDANSYREAANTENAGEPDTAEPDKPAEDNPTEKPMPSITMDDITKVSGAKIKEKRDDNAKIGSLLKTYGVDKVSGLPPEKYEAFLTDISEL